MVSPMAAEGVPDRLHIYLNADQTHTHEIGGSLLLGLEAGLEAGAARFGGPDISVIVRDHQNNLRRTASMISEALSDPATLAVVGGMHTPHYLRHGTQFNESNLVLMLPWSAGAALTRLAEGEENHIFRLSVDDRKAAGYLASRAAAHGCTSVATLALDNGWGQENTRALGTALPDLGVEVRHRAMLRDDTSVESIGSVIAEVAARRPDCVVLVLSSQVGALALNALAEWESPPNVLSHWGILGGGFAERVSPAGWSRVDLSVLATCVFHLAPPVPSEEPTGRHPVAHRLLTTGDVTSRIAFVHAYDLALLLRAATAQAQADPRWTKGRAARGAALRDALERLETPVDGLLKRYDAPFGPVGDVSPDGHEALNRNDLCLARMRTDGRLRIDSWVAQP